MSLENLLPGRKNASKKKEEVNVEKKDVIKKVLDLPEDAVDIISSLAALDRNRDRRKRNFKNLAQDILIEYAKENESKLDI
ncbi:Hypothetical protein TPENAI_P0007 [Tenacibaculum litopenaei]|uniref:hypothetical protein n=1 Tax=Tenacibaculum litopenaei TaxID=396016 RepID=UPI00389545CE